MFTQGCVQNHSLILCWLHVVLLILCKGLYGERNNCRFKFYVFPPHPHVCRFLTFNVSYCWTLLFTFVLFGSMTKGIIVKTILHFSSVAQLLMCWVIYAVCVKLNFVKSCKLCSQTCLTSIISLPCTLPSCSSTSTIRGQSYFRPALLCRMSTANNYLGNIGSVLHHAHETWWGLAHLL